MNSVSKIRKYHIIPFTKDNEYKEVERILPRAAAFTFDGNKLGVTGKGDQFAEFKSHFGPDDRSW